MKIRYIEPAPKGATIYEIANLPKLGLPLLAAIARDTYPGIDQKIYCELIRGVKVDWADVLTADLVCISTTTNTTLEGYVYADRCRAAGVPVLFGGSHVTFMASEALKHSNYVIRREGHVGFAQFLGWITANGDPAALHKILGLSFLDVDGNQVDNPEAPPASGDDLDALPFPALDLLEGHGRMGTYPLMMKWGCPYDCNFCSVIKMFGRKLRSRSVENVMVELRQANAERVFFYDDIFIVDKKQSKALFRQMIEESITPMWTAQIRADSLYKSKITLEPDYELLGLMRDSGCYMVYVGFESITQEGLDSYNKKQKVEHITTSIKLLHDYGIRSHGMFVVGADTDTVDTVRETIDFAIEHGVDTLQLMMLTTLPGTSFDSQMRKDGRVLTENYSLYDGHHCIISPKLMTAYELQTETIAGMARFYSPERAKAIFRANYQRLKQDEPQRLRDFINNDVYGRLLPRLPKMLWTLIRRGRRAVGGYAISSLTPKGRRLIYDIGGVPGFLMYGNNLLRNQVPNQPHTQEHLRFLEAINDLPGDGFATVHTVPGSIQASSCAPQEENDLIAASDSAG